LAAELIEQPWFNIPRTRLYGLQLKNLLPPLLRGLKTGKLFLQLPELDV
jgi:hypothetical protein